MDIPDNGLINLLPLDVFDLEPYCEEVRFKRGKEVIVYELREASEDAAVAYRNAAARAARMEDGKVVGVDGVGEVEPILVARCLYVPHPTTPKNNWANVGENLVRSWPSRVVKKLFNRVKEVSPELSDEDTEESLAKELESVQRRIESLRKGRKRELPKGGPDGTTDTSDCAENSESNSTS